MQTATQGYTQITINIPNKEVAFFKKILEKFDFKIDKVLKKETTLKTKKNKNDNVIQKRLSEFEELTGIVKVDKYPIADDRKNARLAKYAE